MKIYFDFDDWWIGYYRSEFYNYVCPIPTLVIKWERRWLRKLKKEGSDG